MRKPSGSCTPPESGTFTARRSAESTGSGLRRSTGLSGDAGSSVSTLNSPAEFSIASTDAPSTLTGPRFPAYCHTSASYCLLIVGLSLYDGVQNRCLCLLGKGNDVKRLDSQSVHKDNNHSKCTDYTKSVFHMQHHLQHRPSMSRREWC
mmetsp:Transcript_14513/g.43858  ORF Transcript_14513/g.43858 Transcript_14513/m.43858 type:complete len:149 (+) Transcript_14513:144-590(+)